MFIKLYRCLMRPPYPDVSDGITGQGVLSVSFVNYIRRAMTNSLNSITSWKKVSYLINLLIAP